MNQNDTLSIEATVATLGTEIQSLLLMLDDQELARADTNLITSAFSGSQFSPDVYQLYLVAQDTASLSDTTSFYLGINSSPPISDLPKGITAGINYLSENHVTLALFAPGKEHV